MTNPGLNAIATDRNATVTAKTIHGYADDHRIDEWELKAARRALTNLKELLYGPAMRELLGAQIDKADHAMKQYLADSGGEFTTTQVVLTAEGVTTAEFFPALAAVLSAFDDSPEQLRQTAINWAFPMHPEHYGLPPYRGVIETMGGVPTRSRVKVIDDAPDFVTTLADESYPVRMTGAGELDDGAVFTYVLQQFKDGDAGMEANLRIWYPVACPPVYLNEHAEHYTVEFRNGCRMAAATTNETARPCVTSLSWESASQSN